MNFKFKGVTTKRRKSRGRSAQKQILFEVKARKEFADKERKEWFGKWSWRGVIAAALIAGGVIGGQKLLNTFVWENPDFQIADLDAKVDGTLETDEVLKLADVSKGMNIFKVDLTKARERIMAFPPVKEAQITRTLPNRIAIRVSTRTPIGWIETKSPSNNLEQDAVPNEVRNHDDLRLLIDEEGHIFSVQRPLPEYYNLPIFTGLPRGDYNEGDVLTDTEVRTAIKLLAATRDEARLKLVKLDFSKRFCIVALTERKEELTFGLDDIERQVASAKLIANYSDQNTREIKTANLMVKSNIPVVFAMIGSNTTPAPQTLEPQTPTSSGAQRSTPQSAKPNATKAKSSKTNSEAKPSNKPSQDRIKKAEPVRRAVPISLDGRANA